MFTLYPLTAIGCTVSNLLGLWNVIGCTQHVQLTYATIIGCSVPTHLWNRYWMQRVQLEQLLRAQFSLFNVASTWEVPFGIPQYMQCIRHELTSVLLCVPFIFADNEKRWFGGFHCDGKWHLIVDLSSPDKGSVNWDINTELSSHS